MEGLMHSLALEVKPIRGSKRMQHSLKDEE